MAEENIRLVVAEDESSIRSGIINYINKNTVCIDEVYAASNGQDALNLIFRYHPQIMLLDIQMPIKDGLAVLSEASAAGVCPKTIIISGHDSFSYAQQAIRYNVFDYLLKPCRSTEILQKLELLAQEFICEQSRNVPQDEQSESIGNRFVEDALRYMKEHYPEEISQPQLAEILGVSASYLSSLFTRHLGCGFAECLSRIRIECACEFFVDSKIKTYEVAFLVGFRDEKYFSNVFKKIKGQTPSQYRNANASSQ